MRFNIGILVGTVIVAVILIMSACRSQATLPPCCDIIPCEDLPVLNGEWGEPQLLIGSHDFFLEEETESNLNRYEATKCLTCGIYFIHPEYGEHIKTCCP